MVIPTKYSLLPIFVEPRRMLITPVPPSSADCAIRILVSPVLTLNLYRIPPAETPSGSPMYMLPLYITSMVALATSGSRLPKPRVRMEFAPRPPYMVPM